MITKRVFYGSSGYSVARHAAPLLGMYRVIKISQYQGREVSLQLFIYDMNVIASFPVGQAPVPYDRDPYDPATLWTFKRDLKRLDR